MASSEGRHHRVEETRVGRLGTSPLWTFSLYVSMILAFSDAAAAVALAFNTPGTSPSLDFIQFVAPLPAWSAVLGVAAALLVGGRHRMYAHLAGNMIGTAVWVMLASGAILGLMSGQTTSPSATGLFAATLIAQAGLNINSMILWRKETVRDR